MPTTERNGAQAGWAAGTSQAAPRHDRVKVIELEKERHSLCVLVVGGVARFCWPCRSRQRRSQRGRSSCAWPLMWRSCYTVAPLGAHQTV